MQTWIKIKVCEAGFGLFEHLPRSLCEDGDDLPQQYVLWWLSTPSLAEDTARRQDYNRAGSFGSGEKNKCSSYHTR